LFLDGISIVVVSLPITLPLIVSHGFDPVWFGIFLVIMVEIGLLTPPIGLNIFAIQGMTGKSLGEVSIAVLPFFLLMCLATLILIFLPGIALWLPDMLFTPR
jgi:TRAP-type C4-dicarboxylate transport system permease large subunit